jgi:pimeloyl-ACP methyl ester carboxylesterase
MADAIDHETRSIVLPDGRALSHATYGDPDGAAVLFFHGTPGSHVGAALLHDAALAAGVRLVAPDRPGMGESTYQPARRLLDWPADVVALADALEIDRLRIIGYSGGGPYALACARELAPRIDAMVVVSGSAPLDRRDALSGSSALDRVLVRLSLVSVTAAGAVIGGMALGARLSPRMAVRLGEPALTESERVAMGPLLDLPARQKMEAFLDSVSHGGRGAALDYRVTAQPWGFLPQAISCPVTWWHGLDDDTVPLHQAQDLVARIPHATLHTVPDASHLALRVAAEAIVASALGR